ncbi:MAG: GNAT family N-acetyltransferase, partial [Acidobacteriota bacterium]|nr:GNAT family N-acetyltransferase [Acidobacteriota bacterium]
MFETQIITAYPEEKLEKEWLEFLGRANYPSHYTSPGFFLMPHWDDRRPFAVIVREENKIAAVACGIFPGQKIEIGLAVRPQVAFDPSCEDAQLAASLFEGVTSQAGSSPELITLYSMERIPGLVELGFAERKSTAGDRVVVIDLLAGIDSVFKGLSSSRRANIRKAKKRRLVDVFELQEREDLEELHPVHKEWCRNKGIAPDSPDRFRRSWENKENVKIFAARHEGKIVAGSTFRFVKGGIVEYSGNVSTPESRSLRPNDLLMWTALEWAA